MDVQEAVFGNGEHLGRDEEAIGRHHNNFRGQVYEILDFSGVSEGRRLKNRPFIFNCESLHWRKTFRESAPFSAVWGTIYAYGHTPAGVNGIQRRNSKSGVAHKDYSHREVIIEIVSQWNKNPENAKVTKSCQIQLKNHIKGQDTVELGTITHKVYVIDM